MGQFFIATNFGGNQLLKHFFSKACHSKTHSDIDMKPKPYEAQNTKFSDYETSSWTSSATSDKLKFKNRTSKFQDNVVQVKMKESLDKHRELV